MNKDRHRAMTIGDDENIYRIQSINSIIHKSH